MHATTACATSEHMPAPIIITSPTTETIDVDNWREQIGRRADVISTSMDDMEIAFFEVHILPGAKTVAMCR